MTTFSEAFRSTRDLCISQGRRPVACLLGPDMQDEFKIYCSQIEPFMKEVPPDDPWLKALDPNDFGNISGIRLRKMDRHGMAFITAPQPESGFDIV